MQRWHKWFFSISRTVTPASTPRRIHWSKWTPLCHGRSFVRLRNGSGASRARITSPVQGCQADGRGADVQDARAERALQLIRRPDRISGLRPAVLHVAPGRALRSSARIGQFLGLGLGDRVPDAKTVWLYQDALGATRVRWRSCSDCSAVLSALGSPETNRSVLRDPIECVQVCIESLLCLGGWCVSDRLKQARVCGTSRPISAFSTRLPPLFSMTCADGSVAW